MKIKIFVISDIHYPDRLDKFPDFTGLYEDCDAVISLGDYTSLEVMKYTEGLRPKFFGIYGNMDETSVKEILPKTIKMEIEGVKIGLLHGSGSPFAIENRVKQELGENLDAYIFGHSHRPFNKTIQDKFFFNPGAFSDSKHRYGYIYIEYKNIWGENVFVL